LFFFPGFFADSKCLIIHPPASIKRGLQSFLLIARRVEAIFKCFTHDDILNIISLKVKEYFKKGAGFHLPDKSGSLPARIL